jgi:hypothetical protein
VHGAAVAGAYGAGAAELFAAPAEDVGVLGAQAFVGCQADEFAGGERAEADGVGAEQGAEGAVGFEHAAVGAYEGHGKPCDHEGRSIVALIALIALIAAVRLTGLVARVRLIATVGLISGRRITVSDGRCRHFGWSAHGWLPHRSRLAHLVFEGTNDRPGAAIHAGNVAIIEVRAMGGPPP